MRGTFVPGDCLHFKSVAIKDISPGDIIVYKRVTQMGEKKELTHRVMAVSPKGLITRGDNNPCVDDSIVTEENLVGLVTHIERGGKRKRVRGGFWGFIRARILYLRFPIWKTLRCILSPVYRRINESGLVSQFWHPVITKIYFSTEKGPLLKYICKDRTVAWIWLNEGSFGFKWPYDFVLRHQDLLVEYKKYTQHGISKKISLSTSLK